MNATLNPTSNVQSQSCRTPANVGAGVTESVQKPLYNVSASNEACEVRVQLPGVPKSGLKIDLDQDVLTIRGERAAATPESWKTLHREISTQNYQLRLRVNTPVDEEKLSAVLENGILTLRLPVKETAKPRKIEVQ